MFGANNKPFGSTSAFGGSSFGSSTPFGQGSTAFGAKPATNNVFGTSTFGVSTPSTGGLFGAPSQSTGTGLFGQPSSTFGAPASTSTGTFGGFGTTSTSGGLFGNAASSTQSSGGLFGGSTSAFGAPRPTFGSFGATNTGGGLFGQSTSTGTGLFGSTGFAATAQTGTTIKFNPPTGTDTMMKGGVSTSISTRHQCITCMKEYENKSLEELRVEDYAANRKGGTAGGITFGGATQTGGLFGSTPAASTSGFNFGGTTQSKPLFGTTGSTNAFGSSSSIFGQPSQTQSTGLFAKSVGFGTTTTAAPVFNFGGTNTMGTGTSLFGQNNQQKPLFGQNTSTTGGGLFGSTATTQSTGFGTGGFGAFGTTNQPSTGLFGTKPSFGTTNTTTTNSFSFGNTNNMSGGLFGQKPAAPTFGTNTGFGTQSSGFGSFGTSSTLGGTGLFGQTKPTTSVFGNTGGTFGTGLGSTFGSSTFPSMGGLGSNTGTGLFGNTSANKAPGFNFGNTGSTGFNFGSNPSSSAFSFNNTSSAMGTNDPNNAVAVLQQQILSMTSYPFGDSPLFRNFLKDTSRESEILKPTNPSAQKALLNDNRFKVALLPTAKIKPKPWSPSPSGKTYLFDGLEDEEPGYGTAAFLPKKSVKKLILKNLGSNHSTLTVTSDFSAGSNHNTTIVSISLNKSNKSSGDNNSANCVPLTSNISDSSITNLHNDSDVSISAPAKTLSVSRSPSDESVPEASLGMDDSIAALHTNKYGIRRSHNVTRELEEAGDNEDFSRKNSSESDIGQHSTHTIGVTLKRPGYYSIPPLNELKSYMNEKGDCIVEDFTIGREGYGNVVFPGKINVAGLNLDEIVHFERKEIDVYPEHIYGSKKPPVGEGLNREAIVTLYEVWPMDKTTHTPIQDPERLNKMNYAEKIKKSTSRLGAQFIDYIPESGSWIFKVAHFSKYGIVDDSDEEMDITKPSETDKTKAPPKAGELNGQIPSAMNVQSKQILKRKPISVVAVEDDDMSDRSFSIPNKQEFPFSEGNDFNNDVFSPTRPLFSNIDAERIQGMKASFFQEEMDDDNWGVDPFQTLPSDNFGLRKDIELKTATTKLGSSKLHDSTGSLNKKQRYLEHDDSHSFMSHTPVKFIEAGIQNSISSLSLTAKQNEWLSSFPLVRKVPQPPLVAEKQVPVLNIIRMKPLEKSCTSNLHHLYCDAGCYMVRRFRPGWRFDGMLITLQPPLEIDCYRESLPKFILFGDDVSFSYKNNKRTSFILAFNGININTYENKDQIQKNLIEALELQLQNSASTLEGDVPLFVPKPGVELIHAHAKLFEGQMKNAEFNSDASFVKQCIDVWNLLVSLWGKVRDIDEVKDVSSYAVQMARREAVSSWLIKSSEGIVTKAITNLSQDNYLGKIFLYLTSLRISDAVKLAQQHQDYRMSLLLSQAESTTIVRKWLCNQLLNWEQNGAYKFIKPERIVLYALLAGLLLWENVYETINCCKNLDWKQALALHLWYHCEPNAGIQIAVSEYDKSFQGVDREKYALPPFPPYIDPSNFDQEMQDNSERTESENVYDTCYHLLKLYCDRSYRLDKLLMPETYTTDHLDYRLSWLLHLALSSIGFNVPVDLSCTLHSNFAAELESLNMWHWAIFVYLHHPDSQWRMKVVKDLLLRHVSLEENDKNEETEKFLKDRLLLPEKWIFEAKAIKAHSLGKHADEAWFLLKAGFWNKSHNIVMKYLVSDALINEDFDYLKKYLCEMALPERSCTISDWANGGQVCLDYINVNEMVKGILGREISAYDLEKITPEVLSLCNRLSSIPTPTIRDRVCLADMAKKTATIMRSIALLHVECSKNKTSLISLASYFKNLPMPHDYAVSENRFIVHEFL